MARAHHETPFRLHPTSVTAAKAPVPAADSGPPQDPACRASGYGRGATDDPAGEVAVEKRHAGSRVPRVAGRDAGDRWGRFLASGVIVGSHAFSPYGSMLGFRWHSNTMRTRDIDVAPERNVVIGISDRPIGLHHALAESELRFVEPPALHRTASSTTFRFRSERLIVDVLTPMLGRVDQGRARPVAPGGRRAGAIPRLLVRRRTAGCRRGEARRAGQRACAGRRRIGLATCGWHGRRREPSHRSSLRSCGQLSIGCPWMPPASCAGSPRPSADRAQAKKKRGRSPAFPRGRRSGPML